MAETLDNTPLSNTTEAKQSAGADSSRVEVQPHPDPGPCRIDGVVLRREGTIDTPLQDIEVILMEDDRSGEFVPSHGMTRPTYRVLSRTRSDSKGEFTFDGIAGEGRDGSGMMQYRVCARIGNIAQRDAIMQVSEKYPKRTISLIFGRARIRGILFGVDGRPVERARVFLQTNDYTVAQTVERVWRATDASGSYEFEALRAGKYVITVTAPNERSPMSAWPGRHHVIQLGEGVDLTLDAGSSDGCPAWRGKVRSSSGSQLTRRMSIGLTRTIRIPPDTEVTTVVSHEFEGEQGFAISLDPGDWMPRLSWMEPSPMTGAGWRAREPVHVTQEGLNKDLTAGHRLEGRILVAGKGEPLRGSLPSTLYVHLQRAAASSADRMAPVDEDGLFAFELLEEGEWFATVPPQMLAAVEQRVKVTIASSDKVSTLDLVVRPP